MAQQQFGEGELAGGEVDDDTADGGLPGAQIQAEVAVAEHEGCAGVLAAQPQPDPGQQFIEAEGLAHVVLRDEDPAHRSSWP